MLSLKLRNAQLEALRLDERARFQAWLARHLREAFPLKTQAMDDAELKAFVERGQASAEAMKLARGTSICKLLDLRMALGEEFEKSGWIKQRLATTSIKDPDERIDLIARLAAGRPSGS